MENRDTFNFIREEQQAIQVVGQFPRRVSINVLVDSVGSVWIAHQMVQVLATWGLR